MMNGRIDKLQRPGTRFSEDGCTVFVRLRVDRELYAFARSWAEYHATGTVEDQLEGYLNMALLRHMDDLDWHAPPEIAALYARPGADDGKHEDDDGIPF